MKKLYTLALALITFTASAQFEINFDNMILGDVSPQSEHIVLWPADGVTDAQVSANQFFSETNSMLLRENVDGSTPPIDDVLVQLGNQTSGVWSVQWMMYVPAGKTGFWNIQNEEDFPNTDAAQWNGQYFVGATATGGFDGSGGTAGLITFDQADVSVPYPEDEWFSVISVFDLDNSEISVQIDGQMLLDSEVYATIVVEGETGVLVPVNQLGAVNYYAIDENNRVYIDDFEFVEGDLLLSNDSFEATSFNVYPNPVQDKLNIQSQDVVDQVAIYNVLGKLVYQGSPNIVSPSVDMSNFNSGVYFVEVTIGNASKTVKVIK